MRSFALAFTLLAASCLPPPAHTTPNTLAAVTWQSPLQQTHPWVGRILNVHTREWITESTLLTQLRASKIVMLGERHDNIDHHQLQRRVLTSLVASGQRPAVVMEMFLTSQQPILTRAHTLHEIETDTQWSTSGWGPWDRYAPIVQVALDAHLELLGANLSRPELRAFAQDPNTLTPALQSQWKLDLVWAPAQTEALNNELRASHCGMLPESALPGMLLAQRIRDGAMAHALAHAQSPTAVLIAGAGHVRTDRGVPFVLREGHHINAVTSVGLVEVDEHATTLEAYGELPYDVVWFTPQASREDPCTAMQPAR